MNKVTVKNVSSYSFKVNDRTTNLRRTFCCPGVASDEPSRVALGKNVLMISSASEIPCHVKGKSSSCNILLHNQYSIQLTEFWKIN